MWIPSPHSFLPAEYDSCVRLFLLLRTPIVWFSEGKFTTQCSMDPQAIDLIFKAIRQRNGTLLCVSGESSNTAKHDDRLLEILIILLTGNRPLGKLWAYLTQLRVMFLEVSASLPPFSSNANVYSPSSTVHEYERFNMTRYLETSKSMETVVLCPASR